MTGCRHLRNIVHIVFIAVAALVLIPQVLAQRKDEYLYEKVHDQEKHLDHTDDNVAKVQQMAEDNRETLGEYKYYFFGVSGAVTFLNLLGLINNFHSRKEQHG